SIAQRLVRKLCPVCKKEEFPTEIQTKTIKMILEEARTEGKDLKKFGIDFDAPIKLYSPVGCDKCNITGYKGRIGIFEAIKTDEAIEKIIPENPSEREIKAIAAKQGILSLRQDGVIKILTGATSYEEVASVVDLNEE
ncbi:MAG: hypothetical protein WC662_03425, partial [Candidatus Paceibacterota bacterium]